MGGQRYISEMAPDSQGPGRPLSAGSPKPQPEQIVLPAMTGAELRLYAWNELPERHRNEVCRQIRMRCEAFISSVRIERTQWKPEVDRLFSEVVAHLLRATSVRRDETAPAVSPAPLGPMPWLAKGRIDPYEPTHDARVIWVVEETCNRQALFHRFEDLRRRDRGGKWDGTGYPLVAVDDETIEQIGGHYDPAEEESSALQAEDSRRAWDGLVKLAMHKFGAEDDVVAVVRVLADDRDTQDAFGSQWPIRQIADALNRRQPGAPWNDDRVDNAKRRLTKYIARLKQTHGLDAVDLRALLVRYARTCEDRRDKG